MKLSFRKEILKFKQKISPHPLSQPSGHSAPPPPSWLTQHSHCHYDDTLALLLHPQPPHPRELEEGGRLYEPLPKMVLGLMAPYQFMPRAFLQNQVEPKQKSLRDPSSKMGAIVRMFMAKFLFLHTSKPFPPFQLEADSSFSENWSFLIF